jgi:uncharacterized protein involved in type VI secretion and phage assembly
MSVAELLGTGRQDERGEVRGVAIGVVTNNQDADGMARVKVRYPWREDQESYWARIAVPMAGADRGTYFLPEVGDEVLLAFDQDDIRHPYVIGALWNGQDAPPRSNDDGQNNLRVIRSRSGHEVRLDDTQGAEKIELQTQGGHLIRLDDSPGGEKIQVQDARGANKLVIDSTQGSITLESTTSLKIKSAQVEIEASAMMTVKAGGTLTIQGALVRIN